MKQRRGSAVRREFRFLPAAEMRAAKEGDKNVISGYAAVFNSLSEDIFGFKERVMPGAFKRTLGEGADVRALINHDPSLILGRSKSNTLSLEEDDKGLKFRCEMPNTSYAADLMESINRGDVSQCSFGFITRQQTWIENKEDLTIRELNDVDLFDVSVVTYPAYSDTSVKSRSLWPNGVPDEVRQHVHSKRNDMVEVDEQCECECPECQDGDCANCSDPDCDDPNCMAHMRSRIKRAEIRRGKRKTKKVGGKSLTSDKFAFVGDENDTSTWKLPIHDKNHVRDRLTQLCPDGEERNALARFDQTLGIPEDQKEKVWKKIVAAAKKFGIKVSEDNSRAKDPDNDGDDDQPLIDCLENVCADAKEFVEVAEDALEEVNAGDEEEPMLEEFLTEARELQGLLTDAIKEAEKELAEPEAEMDANEVERMRADCDIKLRK